MTHLFSKLTRQHLFSAFLLCKQDSSEYQKTLQLKHLSSVKP
jgi:hypothetical protein